MLRTYALMATEEGGGIHLPQIKPNEVFSIGGFTVTETMISAFVVTVILIVLALLIRLICIPKWEKRNNVSGLQLLFEGLVNMFRGRANELVPHYSKFTAPWYFAIAAFIFSSIVIEMFVPLRPPASDLNFTLTMGITTFLLIHFYGFKAKKSKRLLHYLNPINILTDSVVPFSLGLRMFGNVFSGYILMHLIYGLLPVGLPAIGNVIFTLFHALMQSYIFFVLSLGFIGEATE